MYKKKRILAIVLGVLIFHSCHNFEEDSILDVPQGLVDNSENINKLILGFDNTLNVLISSDFYLNEGELGEIFINEVKALGIEMVEFKDGMINGRISYGGILFSEDFIQYSEVISNPTAYASNTEYSYELKGLVGEVKTSNMPLLEKQILVDNLMFMDSFVNWMGRVNYVHNQNDQMVNFGCEGWWSCWGRCAAGVAGSAISIGLAGCGAVGGISAAVGSFLAPGPGTAIGALGGCAAGSIAGIVGGSLLGSATFCDF